MCPKLFIQMRKIIVYTTSRNPHMNRNISFNNIITIEYLALMLHTKKLTLIAFGSTFELVSEGNQKHIYLTPQNQ